VTALNISDAIHLMHQSAPETQTLGVKSVRENIPVIDLDRFHVALNIGNIVARGVWFPKS
jgi:hypothetical protein